MKMKTIFLVWYFVLVFLLLYSINTVFMSGIPHAPDEAAYIFMAKQFSSGLINAPIPFSPQHFNFFPELLDVNHGTWLFQYPIGHPILLALGILLGNISLIPPLVGTVCLILLYGI